MSERSAKDLVDEMFRRQRAGDRTALDDLVAADLVNHAAGLQGREGLRRILHTIEGTSGQPQLSNITSSVKATSLRTSLRRGG